MHKHKYKMLTPTVAKCYKVKVACVATHLEIRHLAVYIYSNIRNYNYN